VTTWRSGPETGKLLCLKLTSLGNFKASPDQDAALVPLVVYPDLTSWSYCFAWLHSRHQHLIKQFGWKEFHFSTQSNMYNHQIHCIV